MEENQRKDFLKVKKALNLLIFAFWLECIGKAVTQVFCSMRLLACYFFCSICGGIVPGDKKGISDKNNYGIERFGW